MYQTLLRVKRDRLHQLRFLYRGNVAILGHQILCKKSQIYVMCSCQSGGKQTNLGDCITIEPQRVQQIIHGTEIGRYTHAVLNQGGKD